jgi:PAS domain S-box-containing protein
MWTEVSVIPFAGGYAMFSRDISERKLADGKRRDAEQRLADGQDLVTTLLGSRALATCIVRGKDLVFVFANAAYRDLIAGRDPVGKQVAELWPYVPPEITEAIRLVRETGESAELDVTSLELAGRPGSGDQGRRFRMVVDRVRLPGDDEWSVLSTTVEIPEPNSETAADERFRAFTENLPGVAWIKDAEGRYVYMSRAFGQRFGVRIDDWVDKTDAEVWPPEVAEEFRRNDLAVLDSGEVLRVVEKTVDKAGEASYWLSSKFPFTDAAGEQFVGGVGIDITTRIEAEEALREREERSRFLAEENERLYRQQLDIADRLQLSLLNIPSEIGRVRVGHLYRSATEAARVGGDFYDVFEIKGGLVVVLVGDVAGHGIEAARTATLVKDVVHAFAHQSVWPQEVLRHTNGLLVEKELPGFVSLFLGILDAETGEFRFASAGHPSMFLRRANSDIQALGTGSAPLGVNDDATWKCGLVDLEAGDLLLLYTDGVIEARRNDEFFGEKRLETLLRRKRISVERLPHTVLDQVLAFSGGDLKDDVAVLALSFAGPAPGARPGHGFEQESLLA